jgi:hypothetical protein
MLFLTPFSGYQSSLTFCLGPKTRLLRSSPNPTSKARRKIFWAAQLAWRKPRRNENVCARQQLVSRELLG